MMLRNACECLRLGGYFIGTTPNSYEILLVRTARTLYIQRAIMSRAFYALQFK